MSESEIDDRLGNSITVFRYLDDKDIYQRVIMCSHCVLVQSNFVQNYVLCYYLVIVRYKNADFSLGFYNRNTFYI